MGFRGGRVLLLAAAILALACFGREWQEALGGPEALRETVGLWGLLLSLPLQIVAVVGAGGEEIIAMANGLTYGLVLGSAATWLGWYTGSLIQFAIGRTARSDLAPGERLGRAPAWLSRLPASHPGFIILSRWLIPGVGGHVATLVPGAAGVALSRFAWCTAIGTALPSIGWTYAGIYLSSA